MNWQEGSQSSLPNTNEFMASLGRLGLEWGICLLLWLVLVGLMPLQFALLGRWLELSSYLLVRIQLLSASFATKYYHIFKLQLLRLHSMYIFICNKHKSKWLIHFYVLPAGVGFVKDGTKISSKCVCIECGGVWCVVCVMCTWCVVCMCVYSVCVWCVMYVCVVCVCVISFGLGNGELCFVFWDRVSLSGLFWMLCSYISLNWLCFISIFSFSHFLPRRAGVSKNRVGEMARLFKTTCCFSRGPEFSSEHPRQLA